MSYLFPLWPRIAALYVLILAVKGAPTSDLLLLQILFRQITIAIGVVTLIHPQSGIPWLALVLLLLIPSFSIEPPTRIDHEAPSKTPRVTAFRGWPPARWIDLSLGGIFIGPSGTYRFGINLVPLLLLTNLKSWLPGFR